MVAPPFASASLAPKWSACAWVLMISSDRLGAHLGDRRRDLVAHRCDGSVDEQNTVIADQDEGVATLPAEQVDPVAEVRRLDLELGVIDPLRGSRHTEKRTYDCCDEDSQGGHGYFFAVAWSAMAFLICSDASATFKSRNIFPISAVAGDGSPLIPVDGSG